MAYYVERSGTGYWAGCGWATTGQALIVVRSRVREKREGRREGREGREDVQVADGSEKRRAISSRHVIFISWLDRRRYQRCLHVQVALI